MKNNQKGFTVLELSMIIVLVASISGVIGYVVSQKNSDKKQNSATVKQDPVVASEEKPDVKEPVELIDYKDGISITQKNEVVKLTDASDSFKSYISSLVPVSAENEELCEMPLTVTVQKIYKDEFANGGISECAGAAYIWKKENGKWDKIWGGQMAVTCTDVKQYKIPHQIAENCFDETVEENDGIVKNTI